MCGRMMLLRVFGKYYEKEKIREKQKYIHIDWNRSIVVSDLMLTYRTKQNYWTCCILTESNLSTLQLGE
jgi:hypothetical protein